MKIIYLFTLIILSSTIKAQNAQSIHLDLGPQASFPIENGTSSNTFGYGLSVMGERYGSGHLSLVFTTGFNYYKGNIPYWKNGQYLSSKNFSVVPMLAGIKYHFNFAFIGFSAGAVIGTSSNAGTNLALSPSIGIQSKNIQVQLQLLGVLQTFATIPEKSTIQKGGYSYLNLGIFYRLR